MSKLSDGDDREHRQQLYDRSLLLAGEFDKTPGFDARLVNDALELAGELRFLVATMGDDPEADRYRWRAVVLESRAEWRITLVSDTDD